MYQVPDLNKFSKLIHAFSTRDEGNMSFKWGKKESVIKNRERFLSKLEIKSRLCIILGIQDIDELKTIDENFEIKEIVNHRENIVFADGIITNRKDIYFFLCAADCIPIIFFDIEKEVVALVHASWKTTEAKIAMRTVREMITKFNCDASGIYVGIGPCIHKESFRFNNPIQKKLPGWELFLKDLSNGSTSIDLVGYNAKQLKDAGIDSKNIFISDIDTAKDHNFFSHYRDSREDPEHEGRFACIVGLK